MTAITAFDPRHTDTAIATVARAFQDDPMFVYIEPDADRRLRALHSMHATSLNMHARFGLVDSNSDATAVAMWLAPGKTDMTFMQMLQSGMLALPFTIGFGRFRRLMQSFSAVEPVHKAAVPGDHWYLAILAVDPAQQGQGQGSALVKHGLRRADADGLPTYLETSNEHNLPFYERHGFKVFDSGYLAKDGPQFWSMVRQPQ